MIEVSLSQLRAFIWAQPDDRPVNMFDVGYYSPVGDVMVHYGKEKGWRFHYVELKSWRNLNTKEKIAIIKGGKDIFDLFAKRQAIGNTYGKLERALL